jgi:cell division protein DivIC
MLSYLKNKKWFELITNKYVIIFAIYSIWMLFIDNYSYLEHRVLDNQISELEDNKDYYQNEVLKDEKQIKHLKNPKEIEKYAREKYFMKKENEDIFIIEFESDSIKKDEK